MNTFSLYKNSYSVLATAAMLGLLSACGGGGDSPAVSAASSTSTTVATAQDPGASDPAASSSFKITRADAVQSTINNNAACSVGNVGDFYWEIGNATGKLASGQRGSTQDASTQMQIASASKWVAGAFAVETINPTVAKPLSAAQIDGLRMYAGYISQDDTLAQCSGTGNTLAQCASAASNAILTASAVGKFRYDSGHAQQLFVNNPDLNLGSQTAGLLPSTSSFGSLVRNTLGMTGAQFNDFNFVVPIVSGGMRATPDEYSGFLRKMMTSTNPLKIKALLGSHSVCTNKNGDCATGALYSPVPENWKYSLHHWVELDGTFSSPGRNGFYPWITSDKRVYGVLAREQKDPTPPPTAATDFVYWKSVECGRKIRAAWLAGVPQ